MTIEMLLDEIILRLDSLLEVRPFFTTPFAVYTVVEGLLLGILLAVVLGGVFKFARGCFSL